MAQREEIFVGVNMTKNFLKIFIISFICLTQAKVVYSCCINEYKHVFYNRITDHRFENIQQTEDERLIVEYKMLCGEFSLNPEITQNETIFRIFCSLLRANPKNYKAIFTQIFGMESHIESLGLNEELAAEFLKNNVNPHELTYTLISKLIENPDIITITRSTLEVLAKAIKNNSLQNCNLDCIYQAEDPSTINGLLFCDIYQNSKDNFPNEIDPSFISSKLLIKLSDYPERFEITHNVLKIIEEALQNSDWPQMSLPGIHKFIPDAIVNIIEFYGIQNSQQFLENIESLFSRNENFCFFKNYTENSINLPINLYSDEFDPWEFIVKLTAKSSNEIYIKSIKCLFNVINKRMNSVFTEKFQYYVMSVLKNVNNFLCSHNINTNQGLRALKMAELLLKDILIPENMQLIPQYDDPFINLYNSLQEVVYSLKSGGFIDKESPTYLVSDICKYTREQIPIYFYEQLGNLLIYGENVYEFSDIVDFFYPFLADDVYSIKRIFLKPIGYQLLYLHEAFNIGMSNQHLLTDEKIMELLQKSNGSDEVLFKSLINILITQK